MNSILFDVFYRFYDGFMKTFRLDDHQPILTQLNSLARKEKPYRLKIADIGGGTGILAHSLIELGHDVTIIDPAQKMTAIAQKRNPLVTVINEPLAKVSPDPIYDVVVLRDCLHHIDAQEPTLVKLHQILQDDGVLIIQEFSPANWNSRLIFVLERCLLEKNYPISSTTLATMMARAGFKSTVLQLNSRDYLVTGIKEMVKKT